MGASEPNVHGAYGGILLENADAMRKAGEIIKRALNQAMKNLSTVNLARSVKATVEAQLLKYDPKYCKRIVGWEEEPQRK